MRTLVYGHQTLKFRILLHNTYFISRGTGQAPGWFRLVVFGTVGAKGTRLTDQEKQYIGAQYMTLLHLPPALLNALESERGWNIRKTRFTGQRSRLPPIIIDQVWFVKLASGSSGRRGGSLHSQCGCFWAWFVDANTFVQEQAANGWITSGTERTCRGVTVRFEMSL